VQQWQVKVNTTWNPVLLFGDAVEWFGDVSVSKTNDNAAIPSLKSKITKILKASSELPWDAAVRRIASKCFEADDE
jgi:hypothetical protein